MHAHSGVPFTGTLKSLTILITAVFTPYKSLNVCCERDLKHAPVSGTFSAHTQLNAAVVDVISNTCV